MPEAGVAQKKREQREQNASQANAIAQSARVQLLEAKRMAVDAGDERAEACFGIAIQAIDAGYVKAR